MYEADDPQLVDSLRRVFATRDDLKLLIDYQQKLYEALQELNASHRTVHQHVRSLTDAHNAVREDANHLLQAKTTANNLLSELTAAHGETRKQVHQAIEAINYIQEQVQHLSQLETRIEQLERVASQEAHSRGSEQHQ